MKTTKKMFIENILFSSCQTYFSIFFSKKQKIILKKNYKTNPKSPLIIFLLIFLVNRFNFSKYYFKCYFIYLYQFLK